MLAFGLGQMKSREERGISIGKRGAWDWEMGPLATKAALGSPRLIPAGMCLSPPLGWPWVPLPFIGEGVRESETLHAGLLNNAEAVSFVCIFQHQACPQSASPRLAQRANSWPILLCLSPCPLCRSTLAFMFLAWGCPCQPICSVSYAVREGCQVRPGAQWLYSSLGGWSEAFSALPGR